MSRGRYYIMVRVLHGTPLVARGYIYDSDTGQSVWSCGHAHQPWCNAYLPAPERTLRPAEDYARACAERGLRKFLADADRRAGAK